MYPMITNQGLGASVWEAITAGVKGATSILTQRYGVPQTQPGQYYQTGPGGTTYGTLYPYQAQLQVTSGIGNVLLIGLLAVAGIVVVSSVAKR